MEVKVNGIYKHFKGDYYTVVLIAKDSETLKDMVVYRGLYGEYPLWVREKSDFLEKVDKVKYPNVDQEYKFEFQNIESVRNNS